MEGSGMLVIQTLYFLLPAYFANMAPVFNKALFRNQRFYTVDFGRNLGGGKIFGSHKTYNGIIAGVVLAVLVSYIQFSLVSIGFFEGISIINYERWILIGVLFGFGAMIGDLVKSFFKRRVGVREGERWIPFDQLDFVVGGVGFVWVFYSIDVYIVISALILSFILHIAINHIGYFLKIRETRW